MVFLNLALVGAAFVVFLRVEFGLDLNSLLGGATGRRLQAVTQPLAAELRTLPTGGWNAALARATAGRWRDGQVRVALVDDQANVLAGSLPPLPANVRQTLLRPNPPPEIARQNLSNARPGAFDEVRLTVSDEGPGAPEATLKQLFDPFFRPETARSRETGGTGLGLAIVKSCVEACGGTVSASNRTSSGRAVTFTLRRALDRA